MPKKALLVIDMLNDFIEDGAPLQVPGGQEIIPAIQREIKKAREEGIPVLYPCDNHSADDPELTVWPEHAMKGSRGAQIVEGLTPQDGDIVIPKTRYDSFIGTDLYERLCSLEVKELILTGVATEICIHYTGATAVMRGFSVHVPEDCVSAIQDENGEFALRMLNTVLQPKP